MYVKKIDALKLRANNHITQLCANIIIVQNTCNRFINNIYIWVPVFPGFS